MLLAAGCSCAAPGTPLGTPIVSHLAGGRCLLDRKNCWTIAEYRGDANPDALQHLLSRAKWDQDAVRDDLRGYVLEAVNDPGGILVVDETGDLKKGTRTVGVQRQYTGPPAGSRTPKSRCI